MLLLCLLVLVLFWNLLILPLLLAFSLSFYFSIFSLFFFHCIYCNILGVDILHCGANSPWFCLHVLHGRAARTACAVLCWHSQKWISRCFPQIPQGVPVSLCHTIQLMKSQTAQVRETLVVFFFVLLDLSDRKLS